MRVIMDVGMIPAWETKRDMRRGAYHARFLIDGKEYQSQGRTLESAVRKAVNVASSALHAKLREG